MHEYELDAFAKELALVRDFLAELASEDERRSSGSLARWLEAHNSSSPVLNQLEDVPSKISSLQRLSSSLDRAGQEEMKSFLEKSDLSRKLSLIATKMRICIAKHDHVGHPPLIMQAFRAAFGLKRVRVFQDQGLNFEEVISDINLLRGKVTVLKEEISRKQWSDQEDFKPSNINNEKFIELIDQAIETINNSPGIPERLRKQLVNTLEEAKVEVHSRFPSWKKIVGTLVIVSAMVSGLADADAAASNLKKAFDYVVGHSVVVDQSAHGALPFVSPPLRLVSPKRSEDDEDESSTGEDPQVD